MINNVQIGRVVDTQTLDSAFSEAAKDLGFKLKSTPCCSKQINLDSLTETDNNYLGRDYDVRGTFLPAFKLTFFDHMTPGQVSEFKIYQTGVATEKEIKGYLAKVSEYLNH